MGWTVVLQEDMDYYELMGYDYVLDLISEMEILPGFPVCKSYFLVSSDRSREPQSLRRDFYSERYVESCNIIISVTCLSNHCASDSFKNDLPLPMNQVWIGQDL